MGPIHHVVGGQLDIAYERAGKQGGWPVVLLHGFPYDPRCYDEVVDILSANDADVVVPYMRGYGSTRYLNPDTIRSGQQTAFAQDLRDLLDGLGLAKPIVAGFDWGGRAACVGSMLWPELIGGLVSVSGYNVHDIATMSTTPEAPALESRSWYQWYFHSERGRAGLARYRRELARQLWSEWSPTWAVSESTFNASAESFDNPDFVDTVIHSYRHRFGLIAGDPVHEANERIVAAQEPISVPTVVLDAACDPLDEPQSREFHSLHFSNLIDYRIVQTGHNAPQEDPAAFADAIETLRQ
ncbi:alpha/beta hydrolase [Mycobacterium adipatum]|uniref:Alpha/beta hydrolase n=1 Tax=Mycobacterium adipatum TaxID=1682113 RepID=A0A172UUG1_9MYCO|nr:alpha/beta hydrolase [Mycobacterium adipatum]ANE82731.1 alpha/beta hydrolase [Mycobacterium adipatum]